MLSISNNGIYWVGACIDAVQGEVSTGNNGSSGTRVVVGDVGEDVTPPILEVSTYFPSPTISLPVIAGNSSDDESGVQIVELEITGGAKSVQTVNGELMEGPPAWVPASNTNNWEIWEYISPQWEHSTAYTVKVRATDVVGNSLSVGRFFVYVNTEHFTILNLNSSHSSILFNGTVDASIKLTDPLDPQANLAGNIVNVNIKDPEGTEYTIGPFFVNQAGQATIQDLGSEGNTLLPGGDEFRFNIRGTWTLQAEFTGSQGLAPFSFAERAPLGWYHGRIRHYNSRKNRK